MQVVESTGIANAIQLTTRFQKASRHAAGGNEHAIPEKGFRSPHVHRFSETSIPVNVLRVQRRTLNNPGSRHGKLLLRNPLRLFLQATGSGARKPPCKTRPEPASMLALPALRKHVGNFQPDQPTPDHLRFNLNISEQQNGYS